MGMNCLDGNQKKILWTQKNSLFKIVNHLRTLSKKNSK